VFLARTFCVRRAEEATLLTGYSVCNAFVWEQVSINMAITIPCFSGASKPDIANNIPRCAVKGSGPRRSGSDDSEPNFNALPFIENATQGLALLRQCEPSRGQLHEEMLALNTAIPLQNVGTVPFTEIRGASDNLLALLSQTRAPVEPFAATAMSAMTLPVLALEPDARQVRATVPFVATTGTSYAGAMLPHAHHTQSTAPRVASIGVPSALSLLQDLQSARGYRAANDYTMNATLSELRRQQRWEQERLLAALLPTRGLHHLRSQGLDFAPLTSLLVNRHNQELELLLNGALPTTPSLNHDLTLDMIQLEDLLRRGNVSGRRW
jgi:hypothetical protein